MREDIIQYFRNIKYAVTSVPKGMMVTLKNMFREPTTIQYPDRIPQKIEDTLPLNYRGHLEVEKEICTGCLLCEKFCPIDCIRIDVHKEETGRVLHSFKIDMAKCMYCGLCVPPCPTDAIRFTRKFEGSTYDIKSLLFEFIDTPTPVYKPNRDKDKKEEA